MRQIKVGDLVTHTHTGWKSIGLVTKIQEPRRAGFEPIVHVWWMDENQVLTFYPQYLYSIERDKE
jgi:hypothetical protein